MKTSKLLTGILTLSILFSSCKKDDDATVIDDSCPTTTIWYADADADGFGDPDESMEVCDDEDAPEGYVTNSDDGDDTNAEILDVTIWTGDDLTFDKPANADWTLAANQDKITDNVTLTRQNKGQVYNYKWWQDEFGIDPTAGDGNQIGEDFWGNSFMVTDINGDTSTLEPIGGTRGLKWAILDDTGFDTNTSSAADFEYYGTLGIPENFFSFGGICSAILDIDDGQSNVEVEDFANGTQMTLLIGKNLGVWIEDEDIYFTLTFTEWGSGGSGGALGYTRSTEN